MADVGQTYAVHRADAQRTNAGTGGAVVDGGRLEEGSLASFAAVYEGFGTVGGDDEEGGVAVDGGVGEDSDGGCHGRRRCV